MVRILLMTLLTALALYAASYEIEVGGFNPEFTGDITNPSSRAAFDSDLGYRKTFISYFGADAKFFNPYLPDVKIGYMNILERQSVTLKHSKNFVKQDYNDSITSQIDYKVLNLTLYKTLHQPVSFDFRGKHFALGDIFVELGGNLKYLDYRFDVQDNTDDPTKKFIALDTFIVMPYIGLQYQYSPITLFASGSALGFSTTKSNNFRGGISFRFIKHLAINGGYMYENIKSTEQEDKINFTSAGPYGSISIRF